MNIQIFKNYTHQGLCRAIDIFNFPSDYTNTTRILSYRFLLTYGHKDRRLVPKQSHIIDSIKKMVMQNNNINNSVLMELVDILLEFSKKDGEDLLNYLRRTQLQVKPTPPKTNGPKGTIYADSQSVHNSAITQPIKKVAKYLCQKYGQNLDPRILKTEIANKLELNPVFIHNKYILEEVLKRIYVDNAIFEGFRADTILFSLWNWISIQKNDELYTRIAEEIFEMHKHCSTRILSGLINTIQGFTDDPNLTVYMSNEEQYKSIIYAYLDKVLKECNNEKVLDGILDKDINFIDFIKEHIQLKREEWKAEYGNDFETFINKYTNLYTQINIF